MDAKKFIGQAAFFTLIQETIWVSRWSVVRKKIQQRFPLQAQIRERATA
jgi:hypothetical protein